MSKPALTLDALNRMDRESFTRTLGDIFEHSPWIAEAAWPARPFPDIAALHRAMVAALAQAPEDAQVALIRAHPELAGSAMREKLLTADSTAEQAGAGLTTLSEAESLRFDALNREYRERFGFPFVIAVKGRDKDAILGAFESRVRNDPAAERETALAEIAMIGRLRLDALIDPA